MNNTKVLNYIGKVLDNMPSDWLRLTTHRLDIYNEELAKSQFLGRFEGMYNADNADTSALSELPTAYDYIRLGHPLSSVLEWTIANIIDVKADHVITFSSKVAPVLAVLRKNLLEGKNTQLIYSGSLPDCFDAETLRKVYGYNFDLKSVTSTADIPAFDGSTVYISSGEQIGKVQLVDNVDFVITLHDLWGSLLIVNGDKNTSYISEIQHVRRRETIAMTPAHCYAALKQIVGESSGGEVRYDRAENKAKVLGAISNITGTTTEALVGSSGLSIQYAIVMGLIHDAMDNYPGKSIRVIVPPNCYGGTNDQARRVAACLDNVEVLDLPVDGDNNMVQSIDQVLAKVAQEDAVPFIIAEIPTNPRVEVPDLIQLKEALSAERKTASGGSAIDPVFILDQTFCPNVQFLGENDMLANVRTISYVSGSKFPSGGKCTAGYCVANQKAEALMAKIDQHLKLCDNEATDLQLALLAEQLPSMLERIEGAYRNTRAFVNFVHEVLPQAKINFVSEELAQQGFTPSVFSLDLPTKGDSPEAKEAYKRALNIKLINLMINEIPDESKYCVSYGQLKGCYWTIPATSTQGTTKEGDKDYIVRVALSHNMDLERHKEVFMDFVKSIED